jgi:hypothetical protein
MFMPAAVLQQEAEIEDGVRHVEAELQPNVVRIRYDVGEDWRGQWSIFFRVVLSDEAAHNHLRQVSRQVVVRLAERLNFPALGVFPYHNFRSDSEQSALREDAWA